MATPPSVLSDKAVQSANTNKEKAASGGCPARGSSDEELSLQLKYGALAELLSFSPHRLGACVDLMRDRRAAGRHARQEEGEEDGVAAHRRSPSTSSFREAPIDSDHPPALLLLALAVVYPYYGYNTVHQHKDGSSNSSNNNNNNGSNRERRRNAAMGSTSRIKAFFDRYDTAADEARNGASAGRGGCGSHSSRHHPLHHHLNSLEHAVAHLAAPSFAHYYTYVQVKPSAAGGANSGGSSGSHASGGGHTDPLFIPPEQLQRHYQSFWRCLPRIFHVPVPDNNNSNNNCTSSTSVTPTATGAGGGASSMPGSPAVTTNRRADHAGSGGSSTIATYLHHGKHSRFNEISKVHALFPSFIPLVLELLLDICFKNEHEGEEVEEDLRADPTMSSHSSAAGSLTVASGLAIYTRTARRAFLYLLEIYIPIYTVQCPYLPHCHYRSSVHTNGNNNNNYNNSNSSEKEQVQDKEEEEARVKQTVQIIRHCPHPQCVSAMGLLEALQRLRRTFLQKIKMALLRHKYRVATSQTAPGPGPAKPKGGGKAPCVDDESSWVLQLSSTLLLSDLLPYLTVCTDSYINHNVTVSPHHMEYSFSGLQSTTNDCIPCSSHTGGVRVGGGGVDEETERAFFLHFRSLLLEKYVCLLYQAVLRQGSGSPGAEGRDEEGEAEVTHTLEKLIASMHGTMDVSFLLAYYHTEGKHGSRGDHPPPQQHSPNAHAKSQQALELQEELRCHLRMIKDDHADFCSINQYFVQSEAALGNSSITSPSNNSNNGGGGGRPNHNNSLFERLTSSVFPAIIVHYVTLMECIRLKRKFQRQWERAYEVAPKRLDHADSADDDDASEDEEDKALAARFMWDLPSKVPGHVSLPYSSTMSCLTFFQLPVNSYTITRTPVYNERRSCSPIATDEVDIANGSVVALPSPSPPSPSSSATSTPKSVRMALAQWFIQALILYVAERQDCVLDAYHSLASPAAAATATASASALRPTAPSPSPSPPAVAGGSSAASSFFALFQATPAAPATTYKAAAPAGPARQLPPPVQALPSVTTLLQLLQDCTADFRRAVVVGGTLGSLRAVSRELHRWQQTAPLATLLARHLREAQEEEAGGGARAAAVETERLTNVVLQICAQVGHGLLEDLREPLQATSQLCLSAALATAAAAQQQQPSGTHADLEVLLRTVQCARAAIHAHQKGSPLSPDAQAALGFLFCRLTRAVLQLPPEGDAAQPGRGPHTYLHAAQTARYLQKALLTLCSGIDALLHDYRAGCPAYLCEMLSALCAADGTGRSRSIFDLLKQQQGPLWDRSCGSLDTIEAAALVFHHAAARQRQQQDQPVSPLHGRDMVCQLFTPSPELAMYHLLRQQQQQEALQQQQGEAEAMMWRAPSLEAAAEAPAAEDPTTRARTFAILHNVLVGRLPSSGDYDAEGSGGGGGGGDGAEGGGRRRDSDQSSSWATEVAAAAAHASISPSPSAVAARNAQKHNQRQEERIVENMIRFTEYMLLFYQKEWLLDRTEVYPIFLLAI